MKLSIAFLRGTITRASYLDQVTKIMEKTKDVAKRIEFKSLENSQL